MKRITGQKPVKTLSKKSIASFKIRQGMVIGMKVTLPRSAHVHFLEKLVHVTLPRIRDFRGLAASTVDKRATSRSASASTSPSRKSVPTRSRSSTGSR